MANRRLILEYPAGAEGASPLSTHREVSMPFEYYKACKGMSRKQGDAVTGNMWRAHVVGMGVAQWPPSLEEFVESAGYELVEDEDTSVEPN